MTTAKTLHAVARVALTGLCFLSFCFTARDVAASDPPAAAKPAPAAKAPAAVTTPAAAPAATPAPAPAKAEPEAGNKKLSVQELRDALAGMKGGAKTVVVRPGEDKESTAKAPAAKRAAHKPASHKSPAVMASAHTAHPVSALPHGYAKERAAALTGHAVASHGKPSSTTHDKPHWSYEGEHGPQAWSKLAPENISCASGTRQSPIHIEEDATLIGPAEPLQFSYLPSDASVVNNGHTIQVDLQGENILTVRGVQYKLLQFHAHHPAEERINQKGFAMVMHLVHRSNEGKLAVVAVLLDPGQANPLINKVWTHMPLDAMDRVTLPKASIDLNELLPADRRYFQFMGSLTTPPCSEGVLWIVLKQAVSLSREQLRLFARIFPNNARPIQPLHGRIVRNAE